MSSKVYFTNMRCKDSSSILEKLDRLMTKAGIEQIDFHKKFTAIKMHFGEPGNMSFLRPNYAKVVADRVRALGGLPFLTDCNTLYVGRRKHALEHLTAAYENGFSPLSLGGTHVIIADGIKGTDEVEVPLQGCDDFDVAYIGRAIMDADVFISLTHFKGHEMTGFGGAIKNIGMGCGSRAGKRAMHCTSKPHVNQDVCRGCRSCAKNCGQEAISFGENKKAYIDQDKCAGCGRCIGICNFDAIESDLSNDNGIVNRRMAEYTKAVVQGRPCFHISIVQQVSPCCDCHGGNDSPIVPDLGIFASFDPVALDRACIDAVNAAPVIPGSALDECEHAKHDHFSDVNPNTDWHSQLDHAEKIGVGTQDYELITIK